jgi:hypothetical protein
MALYVALYVALHGNLYAALYGALYGALHGTHLRRDALKVARLREREAALLELALEVPHAEPVRERHEDLQGLLREAAARAAAVARRRVGRRSARDQRPLSRLQLLSEHLLLRLALCRRLEFPRRDWGGN